MTTNFSKFSSRLKFAFAASLLHLTGCLIVAGATFFLVLKFWYPHEYQEMSAGRELFFLLTGVDIVIGPLLTLVLFAPKKSSSELRRDIAMVVACQIAAFGLGMYTVYHARPLFLVGEIDRFKTISLNDLRDKDYQEIPQRFKPHFFDGPKQVFVELPANPKEQLALLEDSMKGGPDLGESPRFYTEYDDLAGLKMLRKAKVLSIFLHAFPDQQQAANNLAKKNNEEISSLTFLPVIARADWVAVLGKRGEIVGFLKGDGFIQ